MKILNHPSRAALLAAVLLMAGCGGGGSGSSTAGSDGSAGATPPSAPAKLGEPAAARLLTQGTFGATRSDISQVANLTAADWITQQIAATPTMQLPLCQQLVNADGKVDQAARLDAWWQTALTDTDQLRQRVAFTLSQIMVVSDVTAATDQEGLCGYYDILVGNALGNFRTLLGQVTLSPIMGVYLAMLNNDKPDAASGRRADENFARESMQLFTVGLVQLNVDGSPKLDSSGATLPTYTQSDIEGLARAFTGWTSAGATSFGTAYRKWLLPMQAFDSHHDTDAKTIIGGMQIAAGGTAQHDLDQALDVLFQHPNVGPFIGRQLIQKLVTSNPSPAYIGRVAAAFADNGSGVRGDMAAVVRAVLLDDEARNATGANFGRPREALLRQTDLWRAVPSVPATASGRYAYRIANLELNEGPLSSPSVFNFYSPFYAPVGEVRDTGLVLPELQLVNDSSLPTGQNRLNASIYGNYTGGASARTDTILLDYSELLPLAADPAKLVDELDLRLMSGQMTDGFRKSMVNYVAGLDASKDGGLLRVQDALYLILASPQYSIQH